jgi:thiamine kinase-like enzyme
MIEFTRETRARVGRLIGSEITAVSEVGGGYTPAARWLVSTQSKGTVFVKMGTTAFTVEALRHEREIYEKLRAPFMPVMVAWEDDDNAPLLVLENLRNAHWPPPWTREAVDDVLDTLDDLHRTRLPLKRLSELHGRLDNGWQTVAEDPEPFLRLRLASRGWLEQALPQLVAASSALQMNGPGVIHLDVRSGNICRASRGVLLIDWSWACLGNGDLDTGFWLPSLEMEGGPAPEEVLPNRPEIAACVSGFFAARAGLAGIPDAPNVRSLQASQLVPALRWVARELRLPVLE